MLFGSGEVTNLKKRVSDPLITEEGHYQAITTAAYLASEFPDRPDTWHKDRVDSTNRYGFGITHCIAV